MNKNISKFNNKVHQQILSKIPYSNEIKNLHLQNKLYTLQNLSNYNDVLNNNSSLKRNNTEPIYKTTLETRESFNSPTPQNNINEYKKKNKL